MLRWLLKLNSPAFDPLVTALLTVSRSACTSFNFVSSGGPCDETKNRDQLVGLQEGALVNERPDLPDDLLRRTLGRATICCACMRKESLAAVGVAVPLPTISSLMLRWLLNPKSSLVSPLATALLIASSSARTLSCLFASDAISLRRTALPDFKRAFSSSSTRDPTCAMTSSDLPSARLLAAFAIACLTAAPVSHTTIGDSFTGGGFAVLRAASFESFRHLSAERGRTVAWALCACVALAAVGSQQAPRSQAANT